MQVFKQTTLSPPPTIEKLLCLPLKTAPSQNFIPPEKNLYLPPKNLPPPPKKQNSLPLKQNSTISDFFPNEQVRSVQVFKQTTLFPPPHPSPRKNLYVSL